MSEDSDDKTEAPSQGRLDKARQEGNVPLSKEAVAFASLLGATLAGIITLPATGARLMVRLRHLIEGAHLADPSEAVGQVLQAGLLLVGPVAAGALAGAAAATLLQTGFLLRGEALMPDISRINPLSAIKRLLSIDSVIDLLKTLAKIGLVGAALWQAVDLRPIQASLHLPAAALLAEAGRQVQKLVVAALVAFLLIGAADVFWTRFRHTSKLQMSRQDMKEEARESDGDPMVKARIRMIRMQRARRRMLQQVPQAAVVITNPTHYAVALAYEPGQSAAPKLVAKGMDSMALRIRAMAEEHGVPIVENPPLARALYTLEADSEIPPTYWQAVAEVISYVFRLKGQGGSQGGGSQGGNPGVKRDG